MWVLRVRLYCSVFLLSEVETLPFKLMLLIEGMDFDSFIGTQFSGSLTLIFVEAFSCVRSFLGAEALNEMWSFGVLIFPLTRMFLSAKSASSCRDAGSLM